MVNESKLLQTRSFSSSGWRGRSYSYKIDWSSNAIRISGSTLNTQLVSNSHLLLLIISRDLKYCLVGLARTYSDTNKAHTNSGRQCSTNDRSGSHTHLCRQFFASRFMGYWDAGMDGNPSTREDGDNAMFQIVRQRARSVHEFSYERLMGGIRLASIEAK